MVSENGMKTLPSSARKGPPSRLFIENSSMQSPLLTKPVSRDYNFPKTTDTEESVRKNELIQKYRSRFLNTLVKDCQNRGLKSSGTKMDLINRLVEDDLQKMGNGKDDIGKDAHSVNVPLKHVDNSVSITQVASRLGYTTLSPSESLTVLPSVKERLKQFEREIPLTATSTIHATPVKPRIQTVPSGSAESRALPQTLSPAVSSLHGSVLPSVAATSNGVSSDPAPIASLVIPPSSVVHSNDMPSVASISSTTNTNVFPSHAEFFNGIPSPPPISPSTPLSTAPSSVHPLSTAPSPTAPSSTLNPPPAAQPLEAGAPMNDGDDDSFFS